MGDLGQSFIINSNSGSSSSINRKSLLASKDANVNQKNTSSLSFYTHDWCPYAHRVFLYLNILKEKQNLSYDKISIDLYGGKPEWFTKLTNGKGQVPVLRVITTEQREDSKEDKKVVTEDVKVILESEDILDYICHHLDERFSIGDTALLEDTDKSISKKDNFQEERSWWKHMINQELAPKGKRYIQLGSLSSRSRSKSELNDLLKVLTQLEERLATNRQQQENTGRYIYNNYPGKFSVNSEFPTAIDCSTFPFIYRLAETYDSSWFTEDSFPNLKRWFEYMKARPEIQKTIPNQWWWWW